MNILPDENATENPSGGTTPLPNNLNDMTQLPDDPVENTSSIEHSEHDESSSETTPENTDETSLDTQNDTFISPELSAPAENSALPVENQPDFKPVENEHPVDFNPIDDMPDLPDSPEHEVEQFSVEDAEKIIEGEEEVVTEISDFEKKSLSGKSIDELILMAKKAADNESIVEATSEFKRIRHALDIIWSNLRLEDRKAFLENGGTAEDYKFIAPGQDAYFGHYKLFTARRDAYRKQIEEEKIKNVRRKEEIIEKLKKITEGNEDENSINQVKELQKEWREIRAVPIEQRESLWELFRHYLDMFYHNNSMNNELKDLDRKKNLDQKIKLCEQMGELKNEPSLKKALTMHRKFWDDWKNIGPVPREFSDDLWSRFKGAADDVYNAKMEELKALDEQRKENLDKKIILCEKAEELSRFTSEKGKEWVEKTPETKSLFEEWKTIGPVSIKHQEEIWDRFRKALDEFYKNKIAFFKQLDKLRQENLLKKQALVTRAEELANSEEWGNTSRELIRLQDEYKKIGPVPESQHEKIWKKFRKACDTFFERKGEHFAGIEQDQTRNLEGKQAVLVRLEEIVNDSNNEDLSNRIKNIQDEWATWGFVPMKMKEAIQTKYRELMDQVYQRIRKDIQQNNQSRNRNHYEVISRQPDGKNMLHGEERRLMDRISILKKDIDTLQNNIGFFANSKSAGDLIKNVEEQIQASQKKISQLQEQLRALRDVKSGKKPEAPKPETPKTDEPGNTNPDNS